jgi:cobyrinic acid a,c-diamide synthase
MKTLYIDKVIEQRDLDAAIYLIEGMMGLSDRIVGERRATLAALRKRLERTNVITETEKQAVISTYREVVG